MEASADPAPHQREPTNRRVRNQMKRFAKWLAGPALIALLAAVAISAPGAESAASQTRTYYIAADEVAWDYAPSGINQITGEPFDEDANVFVAERPRPDRQGLPQGALPRVHGRHLHDA